MRLVAAAIWEKNIPAYKVPVTIHIRFFEQNARRDRDNVSSGGTKVILDTMKHLGVIVDDSRKWVLDVRHDTSKLDKENPRVEVDIIEN